MSGSCPDSGGGDLGLSRGHYVMTSAFEDDRSAILVQWVQQCAVEPPMVCVAVRKGRPIEPIIRDSHAFALCEVGEGDRFLVHKLRNACEHDDDVLSMLEYETLATGSPCITRAQRVFDCEVVRHVDFEADFELYIAHIIAVRVYDGPPPSPPPKNGRRSRRRAAANGDGAHAREQAAAKTPVETE